ncbi:MAG: DNA-binding protein WhiA [Clostridia bacterium]|nr:DNA-binding protein WhiA [Clostridia bacterium]
MSFTTDIKKELVNHGAGLAAKQKKAAISAFIKTSGIVGVKDGLPSFFIVSETENVAEFFTNAFFEVFGTELYITSATMDRMSGRDKLLLQCPPAKAEEVMKELGLAKKTGELREGISTSLVKEDESKIAYAIGAFLGGGSCTLPSESGKTGYHLEIVFSERKTARDFCDLLEELELIPHLIERKETFVVYVKSKEVISDFLSIIGADNALKKLSALVEKRDKANRSNRAQNCMAGNADKTAIAAVKQVVALEKLTKWSGYNDLSEELKVVAAARLENPTKSLQELANDLKISKSCLNHRIRRLLELTDKIEK